jgi:hypothetical protein
MTTKEWPVGAEASEGRHAAAGLLLMASRALARLSRQLRLKPRRSPTLAPVLEFYADAGAPEGALYVDGQLVGHLPGVNRL